MSYSFSIELDSDSPDNFAVEIRGQGGTELTERFKAYPFNVEEGHAIHFRYPGGDANIIIENTSTQSFILEDSQPRIRLNLQRGQRLQVRIPAGTNALYPYPQKHKGDCDYFKTKQAGMFERPVICLFFAGRRSEPVDYESRLLKIKLDIEYRGRPYFEHDERLPFIAKGLPLSKAEFFDRHYAPAKYPMWTYYGMPENVERSELIPKDSTYEDNRKMTDEQVKGLTIPIPAQYYIDNRIEPPGYFVGYQYLVVGSDSISPKVAQFYVAAPPEQ
ncbi:hypothetical protein [Pseudomonas sp. nanlin1]|uniref:hypothetical protein n=1 Tax=Pseudomonas sp. nanlin1 TaxID=3040605 RepID=UPI00388F782A